MPLWTIADLKTVSDQERAEILKAVNELSGLYFDFIEGDTEAHTFEVYIGGDEGRAAGIHASEVSNCFRLLVYSLNGTDRKHQKSAVNMRMRFRIGHAVHGLVQSDFHRLAEKSEGRIVFKSELEISPELKGVAEIWDIHSACDGVFEIYKLNTDTGEWMPWFRLGLEIKTKSEKEFEKLRNPERAHFEQTTIYMATLDIPLMWMFYYNKSNSNITTSFPPWVFQFSDNLWGQLEMKFAEAHHLADTGGLPEREEGFHCKWCPFTWTCEPKSIRKTTKRGVGPPLVSPAMLPRKP